MITNKNIEKFNNQYKDLTKFNLANYLEDIYNEEKELDINLMKYIFSHDIDINIRSEDNFSAFILGLLLNNIELTKLFLEKGIDVNQTIKLKANKDKYLKSYWNELRRPFTESFIVHPINFLVLNYNKEHIKILIDAGIDINAEVYRSFEDLSIGVNTDPISRLLNIAIENNDIELVKLLLDKKAAISSDISFTNLFENKFFDMIKILVEHGYDENYCIKKGTLFNTNSLLELCAYEKNEEYYELAKFLIKHGADVNIGSPLMCALNLENKLQNLLNGKSQHKNDNYNVLNVNMIKLLVENGANVNYVDNDGKSILMSSCEAKFMTAFNDINIIKYDIVKLLIENGADINYKDNKKNNVLFYLNDDRSEISTYEYVEGLTIPEKVIFETHPSEKILKLLVENGVDINNRNYIGMTPLMHYALKGQDRLVKILLENGADINAKSEMTAFDFASDDKIKNLIKSTKNNNPQKLVKILSNFTIDKPIKYTTHQWDFGELKKEYGDFDGYMNAVKKQFDSMKIELEELSPNLYKKIYTFLIEENPDENYSWCSKTHISIGWSSLEGLREHCDSGNSPFDFKLPKPIFMGRKQLVTFGEVINLFKQEIEIRADFKNLEQIFLSQNIQLDLSAAKLNTRQFYTDTQKFSSVLIKIFGEMKKREDFKNIEVTTTQLDDRSIEIKIIQINSFANKNANDMFEEVNNGDFADIKESLKNLCDWSIESSFENENFRLNFLHSNNVKDIELLETKPLGFTHILRFYK